MAGDAVRVACPVCDVGTAVQTSVAGRLVCDSCDAALELRPHLGRDVRAERFALYASFLDGLMKNPENFATLTRFDDLAERALHAHDAFEKIARR